MEPSTKPRVRKSLTKSQHAAMARAKAEAAMPDGVKAARVKGLTWNAKVAWHLDVASEVVTFWQVLEQYRLNNRRTRAHCCCRPPTRRVR